MTNRHSKISINIFLIKINRMKTKAFIMATLVCSSFVFMSCDDDDDKFTPEPLTQNIRMRNVSVGRTRQAMSKQNFTPVHMRLKRGLIRKATGC